MVRYRHILFATDFSPSSDSVGERAVELARFYEARISLIHVVMTLDYAYAGDLALSPDYLQLTTSLEEIASKGIARQAERLGIPSASVWVKHGSPAGAILNLADDEGVDLIVVGSHGRHGLELLLGSTANGVLHGAHCDVLAVRVTE